MRGAISQRKCPGGFAYVQDMRPTGMVHGRIVRPPRYGSTLESVDEASVKSMPGVIAVVRDGSFLGVDRAARGAGGQGARGAGEGREMEAGTGVAGPGEYLRASEVAAEYDRTSASSGAGQAMRRQRRTSLEATYTKPYLAHASIGPSCGDCRVQGRQDVVWTHSQGVFPLRAELVKALKMQPQDVRCIHVEGSGCYGQNGADDVALDAACWRGQFPAGRSGCNGCATTSSSGSPMARRCR